MQQDSVRHKNRNSNFCKNSTPLRTAGQQEPQAYSNQNMRLIFSKIIFALKSKQEQCGTNKT